MLILSELLILEVEKKPWNRNPKLLTEAANALDQYEKENEKLKNQITDDAIMHVREIHNLLNITKIKTNIINVIFLTKAKSPISVKKIEYFILTNNYCIAEEIALVQFEKDVIELSKKFKTSKKEILSYFNKIAMSEINLLNR